MRIAFDSRIFSAQRYGGISRYFCEIAPRIERAPDVTLSICAPLWQNEYMTSLPKRLVRGKRFVDSRGVGTLARVVSTVISDPMMRLFRPDIVHETYYFPFRLGPKRAKRVLTIYDMIHEKFPTSFAENESISTPKYKAIAAKRADHVICISESTRRDAVELLKLPYEKTSVTHLGFSVVSSNHDLEEPEVAAKGPYLLYVGHRNGYKNFLQLLKAYASSVPLLRDFILVCFGGTAFQQNERDEIRSLGIADRVVHLGGNDRLLASLYRHARAFVCPSLYEGFGIPLLEAMSHDCAVVCSNTSSIPEVAGEAAEYFEPLDIESMRSAIERVVGHDEYREALVKKGRERLRSFSWDRCAAETVGIYERLL